MSDPTAPPATPTDTPPPAWYCPGCGNRYHGSGTCANGHPPLELVLDPEIAGATGAVATSDEATDPAAEATAPAPEESGSTDGADAATVPATGTNDGAETEAPPASETLAEPPVVEAPPAGEITAPDAAVAEAPAEAPAEAAAPPQPDAEPSKLDQAKALVSKAADLLAQL